MRFSNALAGLMIGGALVSAAAYADDSSAGSALGKVGGVYVQESRGLYIEKRIARRSENKEIWVEVRSAAEAASATTGEMFKVPAGLTIERGDVVATRKGEDISRELNLVAIPNKVTEVVAAHDTLMAMMFGLPQRPSMVNLFVNAQAQ